MRRNPSQSGESDLCQEKPIIAKATSQRSLKCTRREARLPPREARRSNLPTSAFVLAQGTRVGKLDPCFREMQGGRISQPLPPSYALPNPFFHKRQGGQASRPSSLSSPKAWGSGCPTFTFAKGRDAQPLPSLKVWKSRHLTFTSTKGMEVGKTDLCHHKRHRGRDD